ncbi:MAG TPA: GNAT family N-acetyltransferase [Pyrinomonadaceae bacterium]|nr:GNAT family N-acetyltransferase [Pyrinomonadaceae bacterium]
MTILNTERLRLREITNDDAEFLLKLLNEPSFIENIGDRKVRTIDDACRYALNGPIASYMQHGYGLYLVELQETGAPIGICGLVKRESLPDADIGYAFLPEFWGRGYALEATLAVKQYAFQQLKHKRLLAIVNPANASSIKVLDKLGLRFDRMIRMSEAEPEICLYNSEFQET